METFEARPPSPLIARGKTRWECRIPACVWRGLDLRKNPSGSDQRCNDAKYNVAFNSPKGMKTMKGKG